MVGSDWLRCWVPGRPKCSLAEDVRLIPSGGQVEGRNPGAPCAPSTRTAQPHRCHQMAEQTRAEGPFLFPAVTALFPHLFYFALFETFASKGQGIWNRSAGLWRPRT